MRDKKKSPENGKKDDESRYKKVSIKHVFPEGQRALFANHITIQHTNEGEFTLSFFEIVQPLVIGEAEEREKQWADIEFAEATCLARVVVSAARLPKLIGALITNYETYEKDTKPVNNDSDDQENQKHAS